MRSHFRLYWFTGKLQITYYTLRNMFRHSLILSLFVSCALMLGAVSAHAQLKIGRVDMNEVFNSYYKTKEAEAKLNEARDKYKKEMDDRIANLKRVMSEIETLNGGIDRPELSKEAKAEKTKERDEKVSKARDLDRDISEFRTARERQLQDQFARARKDIIEDIMKVVNDKVKSGGYDFVFDKAGMSLGQVPVVLYSRDDMDLTRSVTDALNKNASSSSLRTP